MARLSNAAITMLLCLALQAACFRHAREDNSEVKVDATATLQLSNAFDNHSAAEETINVTFFNTAIHQRSKAFDDRISTIESETDMDIKRNFKHDQGSEDFELESDGEIFGKPSERRDAAIDCAKQGAKPGEECTCFGEMCIIRNTDQNQKVCEYQKKNTECTTDSFTLCREHPNSVKCKEIIQGFTCGCDDGELNDGLANRAQYHVFELIATGGYGRLYKAKYGDTDKPTFVAVKFILRSEKVSEKGKEAEIQTKAFEATKVASVRVRVPEVLEEWTDNNNNLFFAQDFVDGENLAKYIIYKHKEGGIKEEIVKCLFTQLAEAVLIFHLHNIVHRDIKPENLMIEKKKNLMIDGGRLWVIDFGLAEVLEQGAHLNDTARGTPGYLAPELLTDKGKYNQKINKKIDIWSMGVVLYELVFGFPPFLDVDNIAKAANAIAEGRGRSPVRYGLTENVKNNFKNEESFKQVKNLLASMLQFKAEDRFDAESVWEHPWLTGSGKSKCTIT